MIISASALPRGYYARHVAEYGHIPGVLSGAELKGRARRYGAWYARQRQRVASVLAAEGIHIGTGRHGARLWADAEGAPVIVTVS